jgi:8-oxo-dGTP pyrophosphatase MutT (NUDIX family)
MNELAEQLTRIERVEDGPGNARNIRPRDAATLILIDRTRREPHILVGRRHDGHAFMAGKFVFPGGRIERSDARMQSVGVLDKATERRLLFGLPRRSLHKARALALAALRETLEETGLMIGRKHKSASAMRNCPDEWKPYAEASVLPDLSRLTFVARATTPPGRPRRFDTRFFIADRADVAAELGDPSGPDGEFVELKWLPLSAAKQDPGMPTISKTVLIEIEKRFDARKNLPVPYYVFRHGRFHRLEIS